MCNIRDTFPARLCLARESKGWTQEHLAKRAGLRQPYISDLEVGRRLPSVQNLVLLAETLGESTDWLLGVRKVLPETRWQPKPWG